MVNPQSWLDGVSDWPPPHFPASFVAPVMQPKKNTFNIPVSTWDMVTARNSSVAPPTFKVISGLTSLPENTNYYAILLKCVCQNVFCKTYKIKESHNWK